MNQYKPNWESSAQSKVWIQGKRKKGRGVRVLPKGVGYFVHVTSRTRGQEFLLGDLEKRSLIKRMRQWATFSGIGVLTHCVMSNHFHMLLWVPLVNELPHEEILERLKLVWPEEKWIAWERMYQKQPEQIQALLDRDQVDRMGDLAAYMRVVKQSFSNWYNHREQCSGTFWDRRYRSVVVEDNPLALMSVAAYIDLNPLRAGMVADPMESVWSGYGAACGGNAAAREGLRLLVGRARGIMPNCALNTRKNKLQQDLSSIEVMTKMQSEETERLDPVHWKEVQKTYRIWLYAKGNDGSGDPRSIERFKDRNGIAPEDVFAEYERNGEVPEARFLKQKWRCFTRGVGIGRPEYLEALLSQYQACFGPQRNKSGPRLKSRIPGLHALRQVD